MPPRAALPRDAALYRADDVRALDRVAIDEFHIPGLDLMERAGASAWQAIMQRWPGCGSVGVVCGPGNNGGDGFVVARLARRAGKRVAVYLLGDPSRVSGDAATALERMIAMGSTPQPVAEFRPAQHDLLVDGLFGTGLARALDGDAAALVEQMNASSCARVALDIPSGLSADTGNVLGTAVRACMTVSFIGLKQGLFTGDARDRCGEVVFADLDVPASVYARVEPAAWRVNLARLGQPLGPRPRRAHKGLFGHVLVVGGDHGYGGAARLCAEAAARTGAGLTSVATRLANVAPMVAARPELMARGVEDDPGMQALLDAASVLAVGPGLGRGDWGQARLRQALATPLPRVLDADALNLLGDDAALVQLATSAPCVMTPHPGEASRLLGVSTREVERDRFAAAAALVQRLGCVVVLKGAGTLVQAPGRRPRVVEGGNPGMASGGMGDVLTGVVAALLAQGLEPLEAASAGVALHAAAGDVAAAEEGERGLLASDLLSALRSLARQL